MGRIIITISTLSIWVEHLHKPLVLAGFFLMLFAIIITKLLKIKILHLSKPASERILRRVLFYVFILGIIVIVSCFVLAIINTIREENKPTDSTHIEQHTKGDQSPAIVAGGDVVLNYGVSADVVNRLLKVIDEKDVAMAERDAKMRELIEKDKQREEINTYLAENKPIIDKAAQSIEKGEVIRIGSMTASPLILDKIIQSLVKYKNLLEQTKVEKQYSFDDWYYKGAAEFKNGDYPVAITSFTKALKALENVQNEAGKAYTYNYRGTAYLNLRRYEEALADYDMAIDLNIPEHVLPHYNKGIFVYNYLGQYEEAKINLNKAIVINPKYIDSYIALSEMNIIEGDYKSALDTIKKAFSFRQKAEDAAMITYIRCLVMKLLNMDASLYETAFNKILEKDFTISQIFVLPESWFKNANIDDDTKKYFKEKAELLKKHLKE